MNPDNFKLWKQAMKELEKEQQIHLPIRSQQICEETGGSHDFQDEDCCGYRVCQNCAEIDPNPILIPSMKYHCVRAKSKPNPLVYLQKCNDNHQEQNNCSIPFELYEAYTDFQRFFNQIFPEEPKISVPLTSTL